MSEPRQNSLQQRASNLRTHCLLFIRLIKDGMDFGIMRGHLGNGSSKFSCLRLLASLSFFISSTCLFSPLQASAGPPLKKIISHTAQTSPPVQFNRIASASRRVISPQGSGIERIPNTSRIGSCSGYPAIPYSPRSDVRGRR
jgi:hypothetical protein